MVSIPRQAGKTYLIACIIFALCLLNKNLTVIWTAHRKTTAQETFAQFDGMAQKAEGRPAHPPGAPRQGRREDRVQATARGSCSVPASLASAAVSLGVDILVCDEGQIMTEATMEDLGATQNTAPIRCSS
jgi:hypothetical protein